MAAATYSSIVGASLLGPASLTASTTPTSGSNDDGYWSLNLPFNIYFGQVSPIGTIFIGTNGYITMTAGYTLHGSSITASSPNDFKLFFTGTGMDSSCQRIYYGTEGSAPNRTYRIRWEGTNSTSGTLGSPTSVFEFTFYENATFQIDVVAGTNNISNTFPLGAYSPTAAFSGSDYLPVLVNAGSRITTSYYIETITSAYDPLANQGTYVQTMPIYYTNSLDLADSTGSGIGTYLQSMPIYVTSYYLNPLNSSIISIGGTAGGTYGAPL